MASKQDSIEIVNRLPHGHTADLVVSGGNRVTVRRFAPIGKSDLLVDEGDAYSVLLPRSGERIPITPAWRSEHTIDVDPPLRVIVKEIETEDEFTGYDRLTQFHYRGAGGAGRRVPLVALVDSWELPRIAGFIELTSTFLVNTARTRILNTRFSDPESGFAWSGWDTATAKKYSNAVVRISRCVVYPELRGVGLSRALVNAAVEYARARWHLGGMRPLFIEITAEMLRYWPFVTKSGFTYVGDTEGNGHRAAQDMRYLLSRKLGDTKMPQGGGGILSAQRAYATALAEIIDRRGWSIADVVNLLQRAPETLSDDEWIQLHKVFRRPKPTYMKGLTTAADELVRRRSGLVQNGRTGRGGASSKTRATTSTRRVAIDVRGLTVTVAAKPTSSARARRVQEAFGIVAKTFETPVVQPMDFVLSAGEIALVTGPSGAGKSLFLRALRYLTGRGRSRGRLPAAITISGERVSAAVNIDGPKRIDAFKSPIELLSSISVEDALQALAMGGLAEAQLFVRPARTLSAGQRYRLGIALALATGPDVLLVDEFCEPLDRFTALAVSKQLRAASTRLGVAMVLATADPARIMATLQPNKVVRLSWNGDATLLGDWKQAIS